MNIFNSTQPIFRRKQYDLDYQDRQGLLRIHWQIRNKTLFSSIYTKIDQIFVVWGLISAFIFLTAQFAPISWVTQAIIWSIITLIGTLVMIVLTHFWVKVERLQWVLYTWSGLMLLGVVLTDCGIFLGWGQILLHLSHIWLLLVAIGYFFTGIGFQSRAFLLSGLIHLVGIAILPHVIGWQFLFTGLVMGSNLLVFAETQWDMRLPIGNYGLLTEEQKHFNRQQQLLRQVICY